MNRLLHELRSPEIADQLTPSSVLIQPVGAIEQHGPHLPLSTDLEIAQGMSERVVAEHGDELDLWLLPPLAYSKSDEHHWAPGTIWLSATTLLAVLDDLGRSLTTLPTKRLVFVNGHGGNSQLLAVANRELHLRHGLMTFLLHPLQPRDSGGDSGEDEMGMGVHAGRDETSVMLHLRPDLVRFDKAERAVPHQLAENTHVKFGGSVPFGWASNRMTSCGVIGDPTLGSAEQGEAIVTASLAHLAEQLADIKTFEFPRP